MRTRKKKLKIKILYKKNFALIRKLQNRLQFPQKKEGIPRMTFNIYFTIHIIIVTHPKYVINMSYLFDLVQF